jgi:hypothetical protein
LVVVVVVDVDVVIVVARGRGRVERRTTNIVVMTTAVETNFVQSDMSSSSGRWHSLEKRTQKVKGKPR